MMEHLISRVDYQYDFDKVTRNNDDGDAVPIEIRIQS